MTRIELNGGKYTVVHDNGTKLHALRNGEPWRDFCGDGLVLAMAQEIEDLRDELHLVSKERDHAGRNSSAFEDRMGQLQIENGKLCDQLGERNEIIRQCKRLLSAGPEGVCSGMGSAEKRRWWYAEKAPTMERIKALTS